MYSKCCRCGCYIEGGHRNEEIFEEEGLEMCFDLEDCEYSIQEFGPALAGYGHISSLDRFLDSMRR